MTFPRSYVIHTILVQAAERRARDEKACGSQSPAAIQREADKAAEDSIEDKVIDLTGDYDAEMRPEAGASSRRPNLNNSVVVPSPKKLYNPLSSTQSSSFPNATKKLSSEVEWSCPMCTLLNPALVLQCNACLSMRPADC